MNTFDDLALKTELDATWKKLNELPKYKGKLAKPFLGCVSADFRSANRRILYIGKATLGPLAVEDYRPVFERRDSAFWRFARRLSGKAEAKFAWSNLCKIGLLKGNPGTGLATKQKALCVKILKAEFQFLRPSLIVCTAANSAYDDFLYCALDVKRGSDGFVGRPDGDNAILWIRPSLAGYPPILWMKHPGGKRLDYLSLAELEALRLLNVVES